MTSILILNPLKDLPFWGLTNHGVNAFSRLPADEFRCYAFFSNPSFARGALKQLKEYNNYFAQVFFGIFGMYKVRPDILHGSGSIMELPFYLLRPRGVSYVVSYHGPFEKRWILETSGGGLRAYFAYYIGRFLMNRAQLILCDSEYIKKSLEDSFPSKRIVITRNGVDTDFFTPKRRDRKWLVAFLGLTKEKPVAVFVSHMIKRKRQDMVARLAEKLPEVEFVLVGREGDFTEKTVQEWQKTARNLHWFCILNRETTAKLFASADVSVFPTLDEPFGFVTVEAMASGLPVIATKSGATPEIIRNDEDGILIEHGSQELDKMARAIKEICFNVGARAKYAVSARSSAKELFNWEAVAQKYAETLRALADTATPLTRILIINPLKDASFWGLTTHAINVFPRLPESKFICWGFFSNASFIKRNLKQLKERGGYFAHMIFGVIAMRKIKPHILYGNGAIAELPFYIFRPRIAKYVISWHGPFEKQWMFQAGGGFLRSRVAYHVAKFLLRRANMITCDTYYIANSVGAAFPDKEVVVTGNGVDTDFFTPKKRDTKWLSEMLGIDPGKFVAVFAGHLLRRKRPDLVAQFAYEIPQLEFVLIGREGHFNRHHVAEWMARVKNLHWFANVDRETVAKTFASADVLVFPTFDEPFGLTTVEAMASGLPIVASKSGATPEIVRDGIDGYLIEPSIRDAEEFMEKLERVLKMPKAKRRAMGQNGRERVKKFFNWQGVAERYREVFQRITE